VLGSLDAQLLLGLALLALQTQGNLLGGLSLHSQATGNLNKQQSQTEHNIQNNPSIKQR
jgi:hypothetical protein